MNRFFRNTHPSVAIHLTKTGISLKFDYVDNDTGILRVGDDKNASIVEDLKQCEREQICNVTEISKDEFDKLVAQKKSQETAKKVWREEWSPQKGQALPDTVSPPRQPEPPAEAAHAASEAKAKLQLNALPEDLIPKAGRAP